MGAEAEGGPGAKGGVAHAALGSEGCEGEGEGAGVPLGEEVEVHVDFGVAVLRDEPPWGLGHADYEDAEEGDDEDEGTGGEVEVAPAAVVGVVALGCRESGGARVVGHEGPG